MSHSRDVPGGRRVPSWLISLLLHALLVLLLVMSTRFVPSQGAMAERTAEVGIVLKTDEPQPRYDRPDAQAENRRDAASGEEQAVEIPAGLLAGEAPANPDNALPNAMPILGPSQDSSDSRTGDGQRGHKRKSNANVPAFSEEVRVDFIGVPGTGRNFTFVLDRSTSMQGAPLEFAKRELIASLQSLDGIHQFQIIFYNNQTSCFGQSNRPIFAEPHRKRSAERFIRSIAAFGGTDHEGALLEAIAAQPDVIFFLADSDDHTPLGPAALQRIARRLGNITIHVIELGQGPQQTPNSFLAQLANRNGGQYRYVNVR